MLHYGFFVAFDISQSLIFISYWRKLKVFSLLIFLIWTGCTQPFFLIFYIFSSLGNNLKSFLTLFIFRVILIFKDHSIWWALKWQIGLFIRHFWKLAINIKDIRINIFSIFNMISHLINHLFSNFICFLQSFNFDI